jgi:DNA-directed RNA polymerase I subunit RPA1
MSYLPLGNTVGACSEMIQQALNAYIEKNPHGIITEEDSPTAVHAYAMHFLGKRYLEMLNRFERCHLYRKSLEMLLWVKYMRSLASPGDAVGCIAAQSVGEPSTQMTLNTFHLAGHGGANVTLGIPRLREIIMTASKTLKTPTMTIPLRDGKELSQAKFLARKLCQLPLIDLLDHRAGIVVKEEIVYARDFDSSAPWQRQYSIRLVLENMQAIHSTFDISFDDILHVVKSKFSLKLQQILRSEQRKVGEKASGKTLDAFKSSVKVNEETGRGKNSDKESDAGGEERGDHDDDASASTGRKKAVDSDDSSDEEGDAVGSHREDEDDDTRVNKEGQEYENDVEDDDDALDSDKEKMELDVDADDDDDDDEGSVHSKKPAAKKNVRSKAAEVSPSKSSRRKVSSKVIKSDDLNFSHEDGWIEIRFSFPAAARRLLMAPLAEKAAQACMVRSTPNIKYSYVMPKASDSDGIKFVTDGVNFEAIWSLSDEVVDMNAIDCNDIWRISQTFGIEAARLAIVKEIQTVFGGKERPPKLLSLVVD